MTALLEYLAQRKKAILGFFAPGIALFATDYAQSGDLPTHEQWVAIGVACVLTAFGVHQIENRTPVVEGD